MYPFFVYLTRYSKLDTYKFIINNYKIITRARFKANLT